jgi:hypothetical protein
MARKKIEELLKRLEERHSPTSIPPCLVCGGPLSIGRCGGGEPTIYACSGMEDDPDKPGYIRYAADREPADAHYSRSEFVDRRHDDPDVLVLVQEYRKLQKKVG